jgi:hypothetical protein
VVLLANGGKVASQGAITATPPLIVTGISFSLSSVNIFGSYSAAIAGPNLTSQTYFDVRVRAPGSAADTVVLNYQTGTSANHFIPSGTPTGVWTITGVRAHQDAADSTGNFVPVSATITVSP